MRRPKRKTRRVRVWKLSRRQCRVEIPFPPFGICIQVRSRRKVCVPNPGRFRLQVQDIPAGQAVTYSNWGWPFRLFYVYGPAVVTAWE
jgi:hypothetical protein